MYVNSWFETSEDTMYFRLVSCAGGEGSPTTEDILEFAAIFALIASGGLVFLIAFLSDGCVMVGLVLAIAGWFVGDLRVYVRLRWDLIGVRLGEISLS
jgi:hypothetical protein